MSDDSKKPKKKRPIIKQPAKDFRIKEAVGMEFTTVFNFSENATKVDFMSVDARAQIVDFSEFKNYPNIANYNTQSGKFVSLNYSNTTNKFNPGVGKIFLVTIDSSNTTKKVGLKKFKRKKK